MRTVSATIVAVLMLGVGLNYFWLTAIGKADPVFSSWLVLAVSVGLAFSTYLKTGRYSLIDNIGNTIDVVAVAINLSAAVLFGRSMRSGFTEFEIGNLVCAGMIVLFWWKTKNPFISNLAVQALMVVGFLPMFERLLSASKNPEPWSVWIPVWLACVISMVPAYLPKKHLLSWKDTLIPKVYATRATILVTILIILMLRLELRK